MDVIPSYILSVDFGQVADYTAITLSEIHGQRPAHELHVREATRLPLGTSYPDIADAIQERYQALCQHLRRLTYGWSNPNEWRGLLALVVDATGVGLPPVDELTKRGLRVIPIVFTGGTGFSSTGRGYHVAKVDLVSSLAVLLQSRPQRILISQDLPHLEPLLKEFLNFRQKVSLKGNEMYESWREADHDDMTLSVAMAAWFAGYAYNVRTSKVLGL